MSVQEILTDTRLEQKNHCVDVSKLKTIYSEMCHENTLFSGLFPDSFNKWVYESISYSNNQVWDILYICRRYNILAHFLLHWLHNIIILHIRYVICFSAFMWRCQDISLIFHVPVKHWLCVHLGLHIY